MTLAEAEQAVIRAAVDWVELDCASREAALRNAVDALLALRLADAGEEAPSWYPTKGTWVRFAEFGTVCRVIEVFVSGASECVGLDGKPYLLDLHRIEQWLPMPGERARSLASGRVGTVVRLVENGSWLVETPDPPNFLARMPNIEPVPEQAKAEETK